MTLSSSITCNFTIPLFLAYFPKTSLWSLHPVCVSPPPPIIFGCQNQSLWKWKQLYLYGWTCFTRVSHK
jgi:hypothetical protein